MWPKNILTVLLFGLMGCCHLVQGTSRRCVVKQAAMRLKTGNPTLELHYQSDTKKCCQAVVIKTGYGYNPCTTDGGMDSSHPCPLGTEQMDAVPSVYRPQCTDKICQSANTYLDKTRDICVCNIADGFCGTADGPQALTNNLVNCELVSVLQTGCQGGTILQDCTCALHGDPSEPTQASKLMELVTPKTASPRKTSLSSGTRTDPAANNNADITTGATKDTGRTDTKEEVGSDSNIEMNVELVVLILAVVVGVLIIWQILDPTLRSCIRSVITLIKREKQPSQGDELQMILCHSEQQEETTPKTINDEEGTPPTSQDDELPMLQCHQDQQEETMPKTINDEEDKPLMGCLGKPTSQDAECHQEQQEETTPKTINDEEVCNTARTARSTSVISQDHPSLDVSIPIPGTSYLEPLQSHHMEFIQDPVNESGYFKDGSMY